MTDKYYGQYGQDSVIDQFFTMKGKENGFFVDVGASNGIRFSNTYFMEQERGWRGICIEAHPDYYKLLVNNRPLAKCYGCAVGHEDAVSCDISLNYRASLTTLDFDREKEFAVGYSQWYGNRKEKNIQGFQNGIAQVPMRKLDSILEESSVGEIDLLCIDIDGSEKYAFPGLDLARWKPTMLLLEHTTMGHNYVNAYATKGGYRFAMTVDSDNVYVRTQEDDDLLMSVVPSQNLHEVLHPADEK